MDEPIPYGRYTLLRRLAVGGMGEVWLAEMAGVAGVSKLVAIKRLHPKKTQHPMLVDRLIVEARVAVTLTHPNIIHVLELGKIDEEYFIAMEFVDGPNAATMLAAQRWLSIHAPLQVIAYVISCVAEALDFAHYRAKYEGEPLHLVHRDISPENILISYEGDVKLADFGIARVPRNMALHETRVGQVMGKPDYMAPEQARGEPVDQQADIYALGAVFFELLTREKHQRKNPRPPSELRPDVPQWIDELVAEATSPSREARPSAQQIARRLRRDEWDWTLGQSLLGKFMDEAFPYVDEAEDERQYTDVIASEPDDEGVIPRDPSGQLGSTAARLANPSQARSVGEYTVIVEAELIETDYEIMDPPTDTHTQLQLDAPTDEPTRPRAPIAAPSRTIPPDGDRPPARTRFDVPSRPPPRHGPVRSFRREPAEPRRVPALPELRRFHLLIGGSVAAVIVILLGIVVARNRTVEAEVGRLVLRIDAPCQIRINGKLVSSQERRFRARLPAGDYEVMVWNKERGKVRVRTRVTAGRKTVERIWLPPPRDSIR